jgi:Flp pilus assembly protein TadG
MATLRRVAPEAERGQAIIELALTLPLLLLIIVGVFDFGLLFQRYEVVTNAAREGARLAVLSDQYTTAEARQRAIDYLRAGGVPTDNIRSAPCTGSPVAGSVCVSVTPASTPISNTSPVVNVDEMVVTVEYDHQHLVGPIMRLFGGAGLVRRPRDDAASLHKPYEGGIVFRFL